jgi:serine/threonine protein kinase/Flp pilus assembly protein TadD
MQDGRLMKCPRCQADNSETQRFCGECGALLGSSDSRPPAASESAERAERSAARAREAFTRTLETPTGEPASGTVFAGRYQIIEELGRGGMGSVFRALDRALNEEVALKLIKPEIGSDEKTLDRFSNELKLARRISHRHVGRMYELLEEHGRHFITMEYVPGEDLKSLIKRVRQLAPPTAAIIAREIAEGLAEAHRLGIVHRDLKPSNVMIDKEGNAKIMDFGIARGAGGGGLTGEGMIIGTPEYMSPEQVEGKDVDRRSDIYSLGIIFYEMLTGRAPFGGETPFSVALKQKAEPPLDPRKLNPQIPAELSHLILKCLEKERTRRFQTAEEFLADLAKTAPALPTVERSATAKKPLTAREITVKFGVKKASLSAAIVIAVIALAVLLWRFLGRRGSPSIPAGPPSLAVMYFNNNTGDPNLDYWRTMLADAFTADLTQSKFVEVLSRERLVQILQNLGALDSRGFSADVLKRVASQGGVNHLLVGDFAKAGDIIRIHVAIQNATTGRTLTSETAERKGADSIFAMVDELSKKIKSDLNLSPQQIAVDVDRNVGEITTKNLDAYKYYLEGIRFHDRGDNRQAIALYEKALNLDPEFVMAYRALAIGYHNLGLEETARTYRDKALEFKDRFSDRERYQLAGDVFYASERTYPQALEMYGKLLDLYPQSGSANQEMGNIHYFIEDWDKAIQYYENCVKNKTSFVGSYEYLSSALRAKGSDAEALDVLQAYVRTIADDAAIHFALAHHFICRGQYDAANRELDKALSLSPTHFNNSYYRGVTSLYLESWELAAKEFGRLLEEKEPEAWYRGGYGMYSLDLLEGKAAQARILLAAAIEKCRGVGVKWAESEMHGLLAYVHLLAGSADEAIRAAEEARALAAKADRPELVRAALHSKGLAQAAKKSFSEARKTAQGLKAMVDASLYKKDIRRYEHLLGMIALGEGRVPAAIEHFERAASALPFPCSLYTEDHHLLDALYLEPLAMAYYRAGNLERARATFERITGLTTGRYLYGDRYARSFYWLGMIAEKSGEKDKAAERFRKFLDLWQDADVGRTERAEAGERLAALKR